jgi:opacity protein-like surface antigen
LLSAIGLAQPVSAGIKAGLPFTGFLSEVQSGSTTDTSHYLFGPEVELRLPLGLSVEFDALYRRFSYVGISGSSNAVTSTGSSGNWEFPLVAKYKFPSPLVHPYVEAGVAWDALSGLTNTASSVLSNSAIPVGVTPPPAPVASSQTTMGVVIGGGVDIHVLKLFHIAPELRYTRWAKDYFNLSGVLNSTKNQAELLVGFTF